MMMMMMMMARCKDNYYAEFTLDLVVVQALHFSIEMVYEFMQERLFTTKDLR